MKQHPITSVCADNLLTWSTRLAMATEVLRRRLDKADSISDTAIGIVEAVAEEMRIASETRRVSTWPAGPRGDEEEEEG